MPLAGPPAPQRTLGSRAAREDGRGAARLDAALVGVGQLADVVTTEIALSRPGTREGNPLVSNRAVRIGLKAGVAAGLSVACHELRRRDKRRQARLLAVIGFTVGAAAAVHNARMR